MAKLPDIYFIGNRTAGKTTLANYLVATRGYTRFSFANNVKLLSAHILKGLTETPEPVHVIYQRLLSEYYPKETPFTMTCGRNAKWLGIPLPWKEKMRFEGTRRLFQEAGNSVREIVSEDAWVLALKKTVETRKDTSPLVIDDCRYPNEAAVLREFGFMGIFLNKPGSDQEHPSEHCQKNVEQGLMAFDLKFEYDQGEEQAKRCLDNALETYARTGKY